MIDLTTGDCIQEAASCGQETASGSFGIRPNKYAYLIGQQALQTCRVHRPAATTTALGRRIWLSPDPLGEGVNHHGNLYAYGPNRPFSGYDPLGGSFVDWISGREGWIPDFGGISTREFVNAAGDAWDDGDIARAAGGGAAAFADGVNPFGNPLADRGAYDPCDSNFNFSKGAGKFTRNMWASYGVARGLAALSPAGGTAGVAMGRGNPTPFHVAYGAAGRGGSMNWVHATGRQLGNLRVTSGGAAAYVGTQAKFTLTGIPVLNAGNVLQTGQRAASCVTSAAGGIARGWKPW